MFGDIADSILKNECAFFEHAQCSVATVTQQLASLSTCMAVVYNQSLALMAYRAESTLRYAHIVVIRLRNAVATAESLVPHFRFATCRLASVVMLPRAFSAPVVSSAWCFRGSVELVERFLLFALITPFFHEELSASHSGCESSGVSVGSSVLGFFSPVFLRVTLL